MALAFLRKLFHSLHESALPCRETGIRRLDGSSDMGLLVHEIEVLSCSFDTGFNYIQPILTIIYVIREMESVMILQFAGILQFSKVLILLV